jgi:SMC interacting uncharacterized protein involved in chromosome segregation
MKQTNEKTMTNNKQQTEINAVEYLDKVNQFAKENNTDNPRQQTAIEWLEEEMLKPNLSMKEILEQAKEMEKEQAIKFACDVHMNVKKDKVKSLMQLVDEKYNETFGGGEQ